MRRGPETERPDEERGAFVRWFRAAAPYVHAHRGRTFVVAVGGEAVAARGLRPLVEDLALLHTLGIRLVLVHGARPQVEQRLRARGIDSDVVRGIRVTDPRALECVAEAAGVVRGRLEALLGMGTPAMPQAGAGIRVATGNFVVAQPLGVIDGVDFQHTGRVRRVDADGIRQRLENDAIVLLGPVGYSITGDAYNVSHHDTAEAVARALGAEKLVCLVEGLTGARRLPGQLTPDEAEALLARRRLGDDLRRHLEAAVRACRHGVRRAHLVSRRVDGGLLLELFTREGSGTLVSGETFEGIRPARPTDVVALLDLLAPFEREGVLRDRPTELLERSIDRFVVIERDGLVVGCAALHPFDDTTAELGPIVVDRRYRGSARGEVLLSFMERRALEAGLERLVVLTTQTVDWFRERGYAPTSERVLPATRRRSNRRRRAKVLLKRLAPAR